MLFKCAVCGVTQMWKVVHNELYTAYIYTFVRIEEEVSSYWMTIRK